jgi:uncharacterized membrane-anchored protein YjiN (DUF445 family)
MKLKDIEIGKLYRTTSGVGVAIDKGKFSATSSSETAHVIHLNGLTFNVGRSWYYRNEAERTGVAVLWMNREAVTVMPSQSIKSELSEEMTKEAFKSRMNDEVSRSLRGVVNEQRKAFQDVFTEVLMEITQDKSPLDFREDQTPLYVLARNPQVVHSMITLWLAWHETQNKKIGDIPAEDLLLQFKDAVKGIRVVEERITEMDRKIQESVDDLWSRHSSQGLRIERVAA